MAMVSDKNISAFQKKMLNWFDVSGRRFPWRRKRLTHYQLVIAETLLQRTKAETVSKFYQRFISRFPGWKDLQDADISIVEDYLRPIGLFRQRALRLKKLAAEMILRKGRLPKLRSDLESIPFMGQYIANAVELMIHNKPTPLVDVNMARVLERYFGSRKLADIRYDPYLQNLSYRIVKHPRTKEVNWAILDFAALVCKARNPKCPTCIFRKTCTYYESTLQTK